MSKSALTKVQTWWLMSVYPGPEGISDSIVQVMLILLNSFSIMELKARPKTLTQ